MYVIFYLDLLAYFIAQACAGQLTRYVAGA
jgi:hypothetical protein